MKQILPALPHYQKGNGKFRSFHFFYLIVIFDQFGLANNM